MLNQLAQIRGTVKPYAAAVGALIAAWAVPAGALTLLHTFGMLGSVNIPTPSDQLILTGILLFAV